MAVKEQTNPLFEKVKKILTESAPGAWRMGGEDFNPHARHQRPRETYEQVLVRDLKDSSLVLHFVLPVRSSYTRGGYALIPKTQPQYFIEVREKIFDPERLVSPRYSDTMKGKTTQVIASGKVAEELFLRVREEVKKYETLIASKFEQRAVEVISLLENLVETSAIDDWQRESSEENKSFSREIDGFRVSIIKSQANTPQTSSKTSFRITVTYGSLAHENPDKALALELFERLEAHEQQAQLLKLSDVLSKLGLE